MIAKLVLIGQVAMVTVKAADCSSGQLDVSETILYGLGGDCVGKFSLNLRLRNNLSELRTMQFFNVLFHHCEQPSLHDVHSRQVLSQLHLRTAHCGLVHIFDLRRRLSNLQQGHGQQ